MAKKLDAKSRYLSFILRHEPGSIGLVLDVNGWAVIDELLAKQKRIDRATLFEIVKTDAKGRYVISDDQLRIRATQGHSIKIVDLQHKEMEPPEFLLHGTAVKNLESIFKSGILPMSRQYVQLTQDHSTATTVGARHGSPIVLRVDALNMFRNNHKFFISENNVWLCDQIPPGFITIYDKK